MKKKLFIFLQLFLFKIITPAALTQDIFSNIVGVQSTKKGMELTDAMNFQIESILSRNSDENCLRELKRYLSENRINPEAEKNGQTILMKSVLYCRSGVIRYLVHNCKVDIYKVAPNGQTAYDMALEKWEHSLDDHRWRGIVCIFKDQTWFFSDCVIL